MQRRRPSRAEVAFLIGLPLAWAVLLLFHPTGEGEDFYPVVADHVTAWVIVHVGTLLFVPLIAAVVYLLLRGVEGTGARVSRIALAAFVLFYAAWEALIGIGMGLFVDEANDLPAAEQAAAAKVTEDFADNGVIRAFELIGTGSLFVALAAAGTALRRRARARRSRCRLCSSWRRFRSRGTSRRSDRSVWLCSWRPCSSLCERVRSPSRTPPPPCGPRRLSR